MYSWFKVGSAATFISVVLTTGNTHGLPSAVRYAEIITINCKYKQRNVSWENNVREIAIVNQN